MHFHTRKFQPITHDLKLKKVAYLQASFIPPPLTTHSQKNKHSKKQHIICIYTHFNSVNMQKR